MKGLTLARLRNTNFKELYRTLVVGEIGGRTEFEKLLSLAIIFLNDKNTDISRLGYRILVFYCNFTKDYKPLYDVAINEGLIPIVKLIENIEKYKSNFDSSFFGSFYSSLLENNKRDNIYLSDQQLDLFAFFDEKQDKSIAVVAPTSYGKSELIISTLLKRKDGNVCIVVPTKALLAQTKRRLIKANITNIKKIITHPEMYLEGEGNITAVLTQERLLRLLRKHPTLSFNLVFIDEAHNLLENGDRSILLAATISILEKRNEKIVFKFLTPFLIDSTNLNVKYSQYTTETFKINEYIKTERFYIYDFRVGKSFVMYDHFVDDFFNLDLGDYQDDVDFILRNKSNKNLIYLNKPIDIEHLSVRIGSRLTNLESEIIEHACAELSEYMHGDYFLIKCIRKGFIYHHGSVPDNVRLYIENLFTTEQMMNYVITSSTLLEGVNLPLDKMFLLDNKKGRGKLSPSQFKNLIGRVCRFNEIFSQKNGGLEKLEPKIFLVGSEYYSENANIEKFISGCMKVDKIEKDEPSNVLLKNVSITDANNQKKEIADEFIENFEPGIINGYSKSYVQTEIGKLCFMNNITEIDIIVSEHQMQQIADTYEGESIGSAEGVFEAILQIFLPFVKEGDDYKNLSRLSYEESRRFYQMFLNWRISNASYREMINSFLKYWRRVEKQDDSDVYVGRWGDKKREGFRDLWTDIKEKNQVQRINLAIVRIKDEQDFLDNILIKYIEVMNDFGLLEGAFYENIKYGTSDKDKIALIKNGFSNGLANLIINDYREYVEIDTKLNTIKINQTLIQKMSENDENDILIYEVKYNTKAI
ncbi:DEAD/DEAH box helicase [Cohnella suwonensis]|uniref:DEAD/DEAH box helicase n=1 Tax=Cohnella suwonensis TaxID=696072 RepID=A0ABW0M215_9BACL